MRLTLRIMLAGLGLASAAAAQGLPPGILLLSRVKAHMREELARLPNCSCLETIRREHQPAGGKLRPLDTVRLEVLYSDRRELYASPGDRGFTEKHPSAFVASGTIGDGYFALILSDILSEHGLSYEYKGEELLRGRKLARYDYRVPANLGGHTLQLVEGSGKVGIKGSFWADPVSYDIVRLAMEAVEIPPNLPVLDSITSIDYAHTNLGGIDFLLPQSSDYLMVKFSGEVSRNHIEFTHCHLYGAQSSISFSAPEGAPQFATSSVLEMTRQLLPALPVVVKLATRITEKTAVGALVEGVVDADVLRKGTVLIPAGSPVRGRLRRMEWYDENGGYYIVALEFTDIEAGGARYRFFADLEDTDRLPGLSQSIRTSKQESRGNPIAGAVSVESGQILTISGLPGVGSFFIQSRRLDLPPGFRMTWRTRALVP